jgi:hypothetical protein
MTIEFGHDSGVNPSVPAFLERFDQMVIADRRVMKDTGLLAALRQWLHTGGRIWLPLDRVESDVVAALLGHATCVEEVDRVELCEYTIEDLTQVDASDRHEKYEFEEPIKFVRVLTDCADVHCRVNGWPAAFWQPVGSGEVLFTTLEATGFSRSVNGRNTAALQSISRRLFEPRPSEVVAPRALESVLQEQIGYRVPQQRTVFLILGTNCVCLVIAGAWLARRRRLDRMAVVVPLVTLAAAGALIAVGRGNTRRVPSTVASVQVVQVAPDAGEAHVTGVALLFNQKTADLELGGREGGLIAPDDEAQLGEIRRFVWTDDERGRWQNLTLKSGAMQSVRYRKTVALPASVRVVGSFGPDGFGGRLWSEGLGRTMDPVIVSPPGHPLRVSLRPDGSFVSSVEDVLPPGEYLVGTVLSDSQRRRHRVLRRLLDLSDEIPFPKHPSLLVWTPRWDFGFGFGQGYTVKESTLCAIPLSIERTPPGSPFVVPASFVQVESAMGRLGRSALFNPRTGEWLEGWSTTEAELRFVVPRQVQPCRIERARLSMRLSIPSRTLEVSGYVDERRVVVDQWESPRSVVTLDIEDPDLLRLDEKGGMNLTLSVGPTGDESNDEWRLKSRNSTWKIDFVRLDVYGTTESR